jgi:hypothetical protein
MTTQNDESPTDDILWGANEIADAIGRPRRSVYYLLDRGLLPAKQIGRQWVASRRQLLDHLKAKDAA